MFKNYLHQQLNIKYLYEKIYTETIYVVLLDYYGINFKGHSMDNPSLI